MKKSNDTESKTFATLAEKALAEGPDKALGTKIQCEGKGCSFGAPAGDVFRGGDRDRVFKFSLIEVYEGESEEDMVLKNLLLQVILDENCRKELESGLVKEKEKVGGIVWRSEPVTDAVRSVCFRQEKIPLWEKLANGGKLDFVTIGKDPEKDEDKKCGFPGFHHNHKGMRDKVDKETGDVIREGRRSYYIPEDAESVDDIVRLCSIERAACFEVRKMAQAAALAKGNKNYRFPIVLHETLEQAEEELMKKLRAGDGVSLIRERMKMRRKGREVPGSDSANTLESQVKEAMKPIQSPAPPAKPESESAASPEPPKAEKPKGKKGKDKDAKKEQMKEEKMEEDKKASQKTASVAESGTESPADCPAAETPPAAESAAEVVYDPEADGKKRMADFEKKEEERVAKKLGMPTG